MHKLPDGHQLPDHEDQSKGQHGWGECRRGCSRSCQGQVSEGFIDRVRSPEYLLNVRVAKWFKATHDQII